MISEILEECKMKFSKELEKFANVDGKMAIHLNSAIVSGNQIWDIEIKITKRCEIKKFGSVELIP